MKNKKIILIILVSACFLVFSNFNKTKEKNKVLFSREKKETIIETKYSSKLYAVVKNDVKNDYSNVVKNASYDSISKISYKNDSNEIIESYNEDEEDIDLNVDSNVTNFEEFVDNEETIIENEEQKEEIIEEKEENAEKLDTLSEETKEEIVEKNGFYTEDDKTFYYENDKKITGIKNIDGVNHYFRADGKHLGTNNIKVIDVSFYQGDINWDLVYNEDYYGVILRLGYYTFLDKKFERNINELKRLNIPYGIYLFSYSTTLEGASKEAGFVNNSIEKYNLNPTLGIYYDIESWTSKNSSSDLISNNMYDRIIETFILKVSGHVGDNYKVRVYSGRWYAENRLGESRKYVDWVAEYNSSCKYKYDYSMWQYSSKEQINGIIGNVDVSYIL